MEVEKTAWEAGVFKLEEDFLKSLSAGRHSLTTLSVFSSENLPEKADQNNKPDETRKA